jgi:hypothetical protein
MIVAACCVALVGCGPKKPATDASAAEQVKGKPPEPKFNFFPPGSALMHVDPTPDVPLLIQLVLYKITVPAGTVSGTQSKFWSHVDERAVDVGTYELLYKNGVRVGVAASSEWDYVKGILEQYPAMTLPSAFTGREVKDMDTELKLKVPYQDVFYYNGDGDLVGRTFERCDNLMRVSFQPAPRKLGTVRLTMCPVVRSLRERVVPVGDINTTTYQFVHPEQLYDLNLTVDVPFDSFLVVAPSPDAKWPTSLGNAFLINDGAAEQTETLLVFRPVVFRERVPTPATAPVPTAGQP